MEEHTLHTSLLSSQSSNLFNFGQKKYSQTKIEKISNLEKGLELDSENNLITISILDNNKNNNNQKNNKNPNPNTNSNILTLFYNKTSRIIFLKKIKHDDIPLEIYYNKILFIVALAISKGAKKILFEDSLKEVFSDYNLLKQAITISKERFYGHLETIYFF